MNSNLTLLDDTGGTGQYRFLFAANILWSIIGKVDEIAVCKRFPSDPNFLATYNTIMIQRWSLDVHRQMFDNGILSACKAGMANLIYNIDDPIGVEDGTDNGGIPYFNRAHFHYSMPETQENIKYFLSAADFLLVTTNELKKYYIDQYHVDPDNFIIIPNMLPRSWGYGYFEPNEKVALFSERKEKKKLRIGIICSASHFNCFGLKWSINSHDPVGSKPDKTGIYESYITHNKYKEEEVEFIPDDIDDIIDVIERTHDKVEWVSIGYGVSPKFKKLIQEHKIGIVPQVDIVHYMKHLSNMQFDVVIAPIKNTRFNHCKSDIKYMECAAVGDLLFAPNCMPYSEHMPKAQLWESNDDLVEKILNLYNMSEDDYGIAICNQYGFLDSPLKIPGGPSLKSLWLDDNIGLWKDVLFMPRNGIKIPIKNIMVSKNQNDYSNIAK